MNNQQDNPNMVPADWTYQQDIGGTILLMAYGRMGIVPLLVFTDPESFKQFLDDTIAAYNKFVERPIRQGISIMEENWDDED